VTLQQISVVGGEEVGDDVSQQAHRVGRLLAEEDITVINGGGGGVMEASARGVQSVESGRVIGIRPETDAENANDYLDDVIVSGVGHARNLSVVLSGQAVIAVAGRYGTLSEIALALKYDKPVFGVGTWDHDNLEFDSDLTPEQAVTRALKLQ
jgi:uncharacterized protein (TIGR00725 family)